MFVVTKFCQYQKININKILRWSAISNGREPNGSLKPIFNIKSPSFSTEQDEFMADMQSPLELKTRPRFCPVRSLYKGRFQIVFDIFLMAGINKLLCSNMPKETCVHKTDLAYLGLS